MHSYVLLASFYSGISPNATLNYDNVHVNWTFLQANITSQTPSFKLQYKQIASQRIIDDFNTCLSSITSSSQSYAASTAATLQVLASYTTVGLGPLSSIAVSYFAVFFYV